MWQLFQEESLKVGWHENQDSSMIERQARDLEVRVRVPFQVQIFLLKFNNINSDVGKHVTEPDHELTSRN